MDIAGRVERIFREHLSIDPSQVTREARIIEDLGGDSLDTLELIFAFEEEFSLEISDDAAEKILTVGDAIDAVTARVEAHADQ